MKKLTSMIDAICFMFMYVFMTIIYTTFPMYPAYCYKYGLKARSIVYGYWLSKRQEEFLRYLSKYSCTIRNYRVVTIDGIDLIEIHVFDKYDKEHYYYIRYYDQIVTKDSKLGKRIFGYLRYLYWYYVIWIWLDDDNNVNGINSDVFKNKSKLDFKTILYITTGIKVYESIFDLQYALENFVLGFDKALYSIRDQDCSNYLRHRAVSKYYETNTILGLGYRVNSKYFKSTVVLFGYDILKGKEDV